MQTLNNITVTADTSQAVSAVQILNNKWTEMNSALSLVGRTLGGIGSVASSIANVGAKIDQVNKAAQAMSKYGLGKGMLQALRTETADMVDQLTLAQNSSRLLGSGVVASLTEMTDAYKWAIAKGQALGLDAGESVKKITDLLIGGEADALKQFGVQLELTGTKSEKTAKVLGVIRQEMKFAGEEFSLVAGDYTEKMQALRNSMLDAVEGFSLFGKGFNLIKDSVDWVAKKMKKSVGEVWSEIDTAGSMGLQQLQDDVARTVAALNEARTTGDASAVAFLEQKLAKTLEEGRAFQVQFQDLYDRFGKAAGAEDPTAKKQDIESLLAIAKSSMRDTEEDIDRAIEKVGELDERQIRAMQNRANEEEVALTLLFQRLQESAKQTQEDIRNKESQELINKRLQLQNEIRKDITKQLSVAAAAAAEIFNVQKGETQLLVEKDALVQRRFSTFLKELDAARKVTEERRKYGKLLTNGLTAEAELAKLKADYIKVIDGQLTIAKKLNDEAKVKYLIEAKDKAAAIKTLDDLEKQVKDQEVKDQKQQQAKIDNEKERLKLVELRLKLLRADGASPDLIMPLLAEQEELRALVALSGERRKEEELRRRAQAENETAAAQAAKDERTKREEALKTEKEDAEERARLVEERISLLKLQAVENTEALRKVKENMEALKKAGLGGGPEAEQEAQRLERLGRSSEILAAKVAQLKPALQEQQAEYQRLLEAFAAAALAGDQIAAKRIEQQLVAMRQYATEETAIKEGQEASRKRLIYAQYADEQILQETKSKELELQAALRDGNLDRARALGEEIQKLNESAEASGRAGFAMQELGRKYATLQQVGTAAMNAIAKAAWADQEALEKYGGSRLKMIRDVFAEEMKSMAVKETALALSTGAQALFASVFAPPTAPALWASSAAHAAAAVATGAIGSVASVGTSSSSSGGGSSAAAQQTGIGDVAPATEKQEVIINVTVGAKDGWVGNIVDAIIDEQRRGKARKGVA